MSGRSSDFSLRRPFDKILINPHENFVVSNSNFCDWATIPIFTAAASKLEFIFFFFFFFTKCVNGFGFFDFFFDFFKIKFPHYRKGQWN